MNRLENMEVRGVIELRTNGRRLEGYAAVFNSETQIDSTFTETIKPGAFTDSLRQGGPQGRDILALSDHDWEKVLARTKSNTLRLTEDSHGLAFSMQLPDTQAGRDIEALASRGDLGGMSFGFNVPPDGEKWVGNRRVLTKIDLHEISVVQAHAAYMDTSVALRRMGASVEDPDKRRRTLILAKARISR